MWKFNKNDIDSFLHYGIYMGKLFFVYFKLLSWFVAILIHALFGEKFVPQNFLYLFQASHMFMQKYPFFKLDRVVHWWPTFPLATPDTPPLCPNCNSPPMPSGILGNTQTAPNSFPTPLSITYVALPVPNNSKKWEKIAKIHFLKWQVIPIWSSRFEKL